MRVYCLNGDPAYPCYVLAVKGCLIMLDCSLNSRHLQHFLPQSLTTQSTSSSPSSSLYSLSAAASLLNSYRSPQNGLVYEHIKEFNGRVYLNTQPVEFGVPEFSLINVEDLDAVVISNADYMLALPYLTRLPGFRAQVFCTEPVMNFGRMLMEELTGHVRNPSSAKSSNSQVSNRNNDAKSSMLSKFPLFRTLGNLAISLNKETNNGYNYKDEDSIMEIEDTDRAELSPPPSKQARMTNDQKLGESQEFNRTISTISIEDLNTTEVPGGAGNTPTAAIRSDTSMMAAWKDNYIQFGRLINSPDSPLNWKYLYSKEDVTECMSHVRLVGYNQSINVYGSVTIQPKSSGHSIGGCNWLIESDTDCIVYMSRSSLLSNHAKTFDESLLRGQLIDCLILTGLNQSQYSEADLMIQEFCKACALTVKNQGNVLIPISPTGKIYDLIEYLYRYLTDSGIVGVPVYFISGVGEQSLAFSNIFAEWLCESRQNSANAAESPFQHSELANKLNWLKVYPSINAKFNDEFHQQPCIVFASHQSLRFGEACHFVDLWKHSSQNTIIFCDSEHNNLDALAPYQPIYARCLYFPIDTSLVQSHLTYLLNDLPKSIGQIVLSSSYKLDTTAATTNTDQIAKLDHPRLRDQNIILSYYGQNDIVKLAIKRKYENCDIEADLAQMLVPNRTLSSNNTDNISYCKFDAQLITKNNHHTLRAAPKTIPLTRRDRVNMSHLKKYTHGKLSFERFLQLLRKSGIQTFKLIVKDSLDESVRVIMVDPNSHKEASITGASDDENATRCPKYTIEIDSFNKIDIDLSLNRVNVLCDNEDYRVKARDSLLKCLKIL